MLGRIISRMMWSICYAENSGVPPSEADPAAGRLLGGRVFDILYL